MNKDNKYHSIVYFPLLAILIITVFVSFQQSHLIFASGITIYSPFWINYEKDTKSPYFQYCGIFDSCFNNNIRIFPFAPLTTHVQQDNTFNVNAETPTSSIISKKDNTFNVNAETPDNSVIPFELPFP